MKKALLLLLIFLAHVSAAYFSSMIISEVSIHVLSPKIKSDVACVNIRSLKAGESFSKEVNSTLEIRDVFALNVTLKISEKSDIDALSNLTVYAHISNNKTIVEGYLPLSSILSEGCYNISLKISGKAGYPDEDSDCRIIIVAEAKEP